MSSCVVLTVVPLCPLVQSLEAEIQQLRIQNSMTEDTAIAATRNAELEHQRVVDIQCLFEEEAAKTAEATRLRDHVSYCVPCCGRCACCVVCLRWGSFSRHA